MQKGEVQTASGKFPEPIPTKATTSAKKLPVTYAFRYINSPDTKKQYPRRLKQFFDFVSIEGANVEEQGQAFLQQAKQEGSAWVAQSSSKNDFDDVIFTLIEFWEKHHKHG